MKTTDHDFAHRLGRALDERVDAIPATTAERLAAARREALARRKLAAAAGMREPSPKAAALEALRSLLGGAPEWMGRTAVAAPLLAIAIGISSVADYQHEQHLQEVAELDAAVLADELPLTAYLDHGFNAYLSQPAQAQ